MTRPDPTPDPRAATNTEDPPPPLDVEGGGTRVNGHVFTTSVPEKPPLPVGVDGGPVHVGPAQRKGRAGRNLPAAIGVGVVLGGIVLLSLLLYKPAFYAIILVAIVVATWEMVRAVNTARIRPPMVPLLVGGATTAAITVMPAPTSAATTSDDNARVRPEQVMPWV